jgi:hypothetical protein
LYFILSDVNLKLLQEPEMSSLIDSLKHMLLTSVRDSDGYMGDSVLCAEELIQKCERLLHGLSESCNLIVFRHEPPKEQDKYDQYMKHEAIFNVNNVLLLKIYIFLIFDDNSMIIYNFVLRI